MEPKRERPPSLDKEEKEEDKASKRQIKQMLLKPMKIGNFTEKDIKFENPLDRKYFQQEVVDLAKSLLGKLFVRKTPDGVIKAVIV